MLACPSPSHAAYHDAVLGWGPGVAGGHIGPERAGRSFRANSPPPSTFRRPTFLGCVWRGHECAPDAFTCILAMYPTLLGFVTGRGLENTPKAKPKYKDFRISVFCSGCWAGCPRAFETLHVYLNNCMFASATLPNEILDARKIQRFANLCTLICGVRGSYSRTAVQAQ